MGGVYEGGVLGMGLVCIRCLCGGGMWGCLGGVGVSGRGVCVCGWVWFYRGEVCLVGMLLWGCVGNLVCRGVGK